MGVGKRKRPGRFVAACALLASALVPASTASATPPVLTPSGVGATGGLVSASWTLPQNVTSQFFEIAKYPDVNASGYFRQKLVRPGQPEDGAESQVRFGTLNSTQTSLTPSDPTPPLSAGTYYVHIAGHDSRHTGCPQIEFSDIAEVVIGASGNATSTGIAAPGTGVCTRIRGGGGGGGGTVVPGDTTPPTTQLRYSRRQDIDRLRVRARMSEPGTFTVRALVDVGGLLARIYNFKPARRKVTGGVLTTLRPRLSARNKRALKRAMRRGKRLRARITLTATDRAGNTKTQHATIRLRP